MGGSMGEATAEGFTGRTLVFTVTPGRSGSTLLTRLLHDVAGVHAEHEPAPRLNYVMRSFVAAPSAARGWLLNEKLPAIRAAMRSDLYVETSHLTCKGFIEPLLDLGLDLRFIILTRPATEVAESLHAMGCIPERTEAGRLVCLGPTDPGVLPVLSWRDLSDYQLCYWYALEIERRQESYARLFHARGIPVATIGLRELCRWDRFVRLAAFVDPRAVPDRPAYDAVIAHNQNPVSRFTGGCPPREAPADRADQELRLRARLPWVERIAG